MCCPRPPLPTASQICIIWYDLLLNDVVPVVFDRLPLLLPLAATIKTVGRLYPLEYFLEVNEPLPYSNC